MEICNHSGAAGACAGCDGITTSQKVSEGTKNFGIRSDPIHRQIVPPHTLDGEVRNLCQKWNILLGKSKEF